MPRIRSAFCCALVTIVLGVVVSCGPLSEGPEVVEPDGFPELSGPYLGQAPPGAEPVLFAPGVISTGLAELNSVFTPDGSEFYYAVDVGIDWVIMVSRQIDGRWSVPEVASFTRSDSGVDLCISPDGQRLFYCSNRSHSGGAIPEDNMDIWYVDRMDDGTWSAPVNLAAVNSDSAEFYPSLTTDGTLYFLSRRPGGYGGGDIYRSRVKDGHYTEPENLGPVINNSGNQGDAFVAPDESYLIFNSRGHDTAPGYGSLYISFRGDDDSWGPPQNLALAMTADRSDFCPMLSPDGRYFFFSSARPSFGAGGAITWLSLHQAQSRPENGNTDLYWVDASFIDRLRP
jgi:hypothetical protein